jgi:hypothetical protein
MELFTHLLPPWKQRGFAKALEKYETECENTEQDGAGQIHYKQPEKVSKALEKAISFTLLR